jgi:hypothetical protein
MDSLPALNLALTNVRSFVLSNHVPKKKEEISRHLKLCYIAVSLAFANGEGEEGVSEVQQSLLASIADTLAQCHSCDDNVPLQQAGGLDSLLGLCQRQLQTMNINHVKLQDMLNRLRYPLTPVQVVIWHRPTPVQTAAGHPAESSWKFTEPLKRDPPSALRSAVRNLTHRRTFDMPEPTQTANNTSATIVPQPAP